MTAIEPPSLIGETESAVQSPRQATHLFIPGSWRPDSEKHEREMIVAAPGQSLHGRRTDASIGSVSGSSGATLAD